MSKVYSINLSGKNAEAFAEAVERSKNSDYDYEKEYKKSLKAIYELSDRLKENK